MAVEFTIEGLNERQRFLADVIWECQSGVQVKAFIRGLPTPALRQEAENIVELMKLAVVEQCYDGIDQAMEEAQRLIDKTRKD